MSKLLGAGFALIAASALAGCATSGAALYTASPNPPPPRGYRVECHSEPGIAWRFFFDFHSDCHPVVAPAESRTVIRARG